jgi:hypothetical protein
MKEPKPKKEPEEDFVRLGSITITKIINSDNEIELITECSDELYQWDVVGMLTIVIDEFRQPVWFEDHEEDRE